MKIGIDCRLWNETGVGRYIRNLIGQLKVMDRRNTYTLFVLPEDEEGIKFAVRSSQFAVQLADIRWHSIEEQLKFPNILNKENLDLVHFPYFSVPIFYNRPFVVTIHDLIINHFSTGRASTLPFPIYSLKLFGYKFVMSQAVKKAKKIITVSNATKKEIIDHLGVSPQKVVVTYEGVDGKITSSKSQIPNKFQISNLPTSLKLRGASKTQKYFLYVGNAYPHKNLERLLKAFQMLNSDVSLVLVGKEDYFYKRLKSKVRDMKLSEKVIFLENVTDSELSSLYRNAIALVVPSLMEGFGLPALEAMANKCLVLASDIPALREVCDDAAIYFDPYNPSDIAEKMRNICFNDLNHLSGEMEKGLKRIKLFSWEKMAKETLKIYESGISV